MVQRKLRLLPSAVLPFLCAGNALAEAADGSAGMQSPIVTVLLIAAVILAVFLLADGIHRLRLRFRLRVFPLRLPEKERYALLERNHFSCSLCGQRAGEDRVLSPCWMDTGNPRLRGERILCSECLKRRFHGHYSKISASARRRERSYLTPELRRAVFEKYGRRCCLCGRTEKDGVTFEIDHKIPVSCGGRTELNNLQVLCRDCNQGKGARANLR